MEGKEVLVWGPTAAVEEAFGEIEKIVDEQREIETKRQQRKAKKANNLDPSNLEPGHTIQSCILSNTMRKDLPSSVARECKVGYEIQDGAAGKNSKVLFWGTQQDVEKASEKMREAFRKAKKRQTKAQEFNKAAVESKSSIAAMDRSKRKEQNQKNHAATKESVAERSKRHKQKQKEKKQSRSMGLQYRG